MTYARGSKEKEALRRQAVLDCLADGPKSTEQIRAFMCEDKSVAYKHIKLLEAEGIVQGNNPKRSEFKRWRIRPSLSQTGEQASSSAA